MFTRYVTLVKFNLITMTFRQSISSVFSKYATLSGRASRSEYWYFSLFQAIICGAITLIFGLYKSDTGFVQIMGYVLYGLYWLVTVIPSLAVSVRRMHDIGKGGGWIFINMVPLIGSIWYFILTVLPSQPYPNRFDAGR